MQLVACVLLSMVACRPTASEPDVATLIPGQPVTAAELVGEEFDSMFVFPPYTPASEVVRAIGFEWESPDLVSLESQDSNILFVAVRGPEVGWEALVSRSAVDIDQQLGPLTPESTLEIEVRNGRVTTWTYDDYDRAIKVVDNDVASPVLPTDDVTTEFAYDTDGNQVAVKSPTAAGGASGYRVTRSLFDALGRGTRVIENCTDSGTTPPSAWQTCAGNGTWNAVTNLETTFTYDADGNRLSVMAPSPAATSGTDTALVTTRYAYG